MSAAHDATTGTVPGAYGLRVLGLGPETDGLCRVPVEAPELEVVLVRQADEVPPGARETSMELVDGWLHSSRSARSATYVVDDPPTPDELLHPYLAQAAINRSLALERLVLHGGLLGSAAGAVAVVGDREAGKSTFLAHAALTGMSVLSDDVVVVDREWVYTGPRCIDLREGAAGFFGPRQVRPARRGTRWRLPLPPAPWRTPLAAAVVLGWGPEVDVERLAPRERLHALAPHLACGPTADARVSLLDLAAMPVLHLRRPRSLDLLGSALDAVLDVLEQQ